MTTNRSDDKKNNVGDTQKIQMSHESNQFEKTQASIINEIKSSIDPQQAGLVIDAVVKENDILRINKPEYVVGIGASAGGLEALELLFTHMPYKTGMAYVVIQHLSPDYKSMMAELLARKTMIPIKVAVDQMLLEADTIYLLPPKKEMITANGRLLLTDREYSEVLNLPINIFFRSLAETYQEKSIAIVLSGTGSDGSKGVVKVHDSGGFVIAQMPDSCKFESMPENAIKTNKVDLVFNPESIPDALVKYSKRTTKVVQQLQLGNLDAEVSEFSEILILLNNRFDLDFSQYKPSTITRRLERRVSYQKSSSLKDYIDILLTNKDELEALYYDLLIGVTQFFRDPAAFNSLRSMVPKLLEIFKDEPEIRIWVAACASGQEAYSMAMMMHDIMKKDPNGDKPFKIFATDIHNLSLKTAAAGVYSEDEVEGLEGDFQSRFFTKTVNNMYQIVPEIRKSIVFAQHNLLKDPPFTRTHLLSCRNLLIYFNNTAQQQVLSLFSFSLLNQGIMFMGPSEAIGAYSSDFEMIDTVNRLFRKTRTTTRPNALPLMLRNRKSSRDSSVSKLPERSPTSLKSKKALEMLLQKYVPASILVDEKGDILHVFGDAGHFLSLSFGSATLNITALVKEEARAVLSQMIHRIGRHYKPIKNINVKGFSNVERVDIEMHVLSDSPSDLNYIIVSLRESGSVATKEVYEAELITTKMSVNTTLYADVKIKELEEELIYTQENLQTTVEELETSNEELQASNEELMASNEELQSTNEELQSVNEELFTVNGEFEQKDLEREELKSDENSIIEESSLGILFLDHDLKIRKFSPFASELFNISRADVGQPFAMASGHVVKEIQSDVYSVFHSGELIEKEIGDDKSL
jgi:two-component system CheB/CheR fusion protein